jgi:hypothetical protein
MEPRRGIADVSAAGQQNAVTYFGVALGGDHGDEAAQRVPNDRVLFGGKSCAVRISVSAPSWIHRQRSANVRVASPPEELQGIVVIGHRDSNHPEACRKKTASISVAPEANPRGHGHRGDTFD